MTGTPCFLKKSCKVLNISVTEIYDEGVDDYLEKVLLSLRAIWEQKYQRGLKGLKSLSYFKINKKGNLDPPNPSGFLAPKLALSIPQFHCNDHFVKATIVLAA